MPPSTPFRPQSNFERLVDEDIRDLTSALWRTPLGDSHKVAFLQGKHEGLQRALLLARKAATGMNEEDLDDIPS